MKGTGLVCLTPLIIPSLGNTEQICMAGLTEVMGIMEDSTLVNHLMYWDMVKKISFKAPIRKWPYSFLASIFKEVICMKKIF